VARLSPLDRLLYWIKERHQIYLRRRAGKSKPWTDDRVLQENFFTNPYRENDKVTAWFRRHVRGPMQDDPGVMFATIAFRWFNYIPTGEILLGGDHMQGWHADYRRDNLLTHWSCALAITRLKALANERGKLFTGAFNISNGGSTKSKLDRVCEDYVEPAWCQRERLVSQLSEPGMTMQNAHAILGQLPGMGGSGFMAYEVVCDLRYTYLLRNASDCCTWSNPGPGAKRGLNRLLGRDLGYSCRDYPQESLKLLRAVTNRLGGSMPPFEMREIEHSLCEFFKYEMAVDQLMKGGSEYGLKRRYNGT
jgi:hypothetical protein